VARAIAYAYNELDRGLGRAAGEDLTLDPDASEAMIYGRRKELSGRRRRGHLADRLLIRA